MDSFDKKRQMVKVLQDMLKHSASEEVSKGLPKPAMSPSTPPPAMKEGGMVDLTKEGRSLEVPTSEDKHMAEGGMPEASDEPMREMPSELPSEDVTNPALENLPEAPHDDVAEEAMLQDEHNKDMEYEDEDNNSSSFEGFFPRKKKK